MSQKLDNLSDSEIEQILDDDAFAFCKNAERIPRPYSHRDYDKSGTSFIPDLPDSEFERNLEDLSCGFVRTHNEVIELERERMKECVKRHRLYCDAWSRLSGLHRIWQMSIAIYTEIYR